jgi:hypothetical protein
MIQILTGCRSARWFHIYGWMVVVVTGRVYYYCKLLYDDTAIIVPTTTRNTDVNLTTTASTTTATTTSNKGTKDGHHHNNNDDNKSIHQNDAGSRKRQRTAAVTTKTSTPSFTTARNCSSSMPATYASTYDDDDDDDDDDIDHYKCNNNSKIKSPTKNDVVDTQTATTTTTITNATSNSISIDTTASMPLEGWIIELISPITTNTNRSNMSSTYNSNNSKNYAILCVPQCYESILLQACQHQYILQFHACIMLPLTLHPTTPTTTNHYHPTNHLSTFTATKITATINVTSMLLCPTTAPPPTRIRETPNDDNVHDDHDGGMILPDMQQKVRIVPPSPQPKQQQLQLQLQSTLLPPQSLRHTTLIPAKVSTDHPQSNSSSSQQQQQQQRQLQHHSPTTPTICCWTLQRLAQLETLESMDATNDTSTTTMMKIVAAASNKKQKQKVRRYTVTGRVVSRSPILSVDGKNPFVLIELIQNDDQTTKTHDAEEVMIQFQCWVVLRKEGLLYHTALVPYNTVVTLHQVRKQQWRVPSIVVAQQQISSRSATFDNNSNNSRTNTTINTTTSTLPPPWSVFVVDTSQQMEFCQTDRPSFQFNSYHSLHCNDKNSIRMPSISTASTVATTTTSKSFPNPTVTTTNTTTISGQIHKIHCRNRSSPSGGKVVHMIEIRTLPPTSFTTIPPSQQQAPMIKLYTCYYPMSTSMSLLLRLWQHHFESRRTLCSTHPSTTSFVNNNIHNSSSMEIHIQGYNVQSLGYNAYAANVYTTITITHVSAIPLEPIHMSQPFPIPYDIIQLPRTYEQVWITDLIYDTIYRFFQDGPGHLYFQSNAISIPSMTDVRDKLFNPSHPDMQPRKTTTRNVYTEYFTRPNYKANEITALDIQHDANSSSILQPFMNPIIHLPFLVNVSEIQKCAFKAMTQHLRSYIIQSTNPMWTVGWTGTKQYFGSSMYELLVCITKYGTVNWDSQQQCMYTFGFGTTTKVFSDGKQQCTATIISDGKMTLPVLWIDDMSSRNEIYVDDSFLWVAIRGLSVSCICIGRCTPRVMNSSNHTNRRSPWRDSECQTLPLYNCTDKGNDVTATTAYGPCGICVVNGYLFMLSVSVICDEHSAVGHTNRVREIVSNRNSEQIEDAGNIISLEQCLNPILRTAEDAKSVVVALLTRGIYKLGKLKSNVYSYYSMTLAHVSVDHQDSTPAVVWSTLQSVEVRPPVLLDSTRSKALQGHINTLLGVTIPFSEERLHLGVVWWKMACFPQTCALLCGGWDESVRTHHNTSKILGVIVQLPSTSVHRDSKRGYTRFRCNVESLVARVRMFDQPDNNCLPLVKSKNENQRFDFISTSNKFLPGMLDRRPIRRKYGGVAYGECLHYREDSQSISNIGIPRNRLSDLVVLMCGDLQSTSDRYHMAPSLTREIRNAWMLGINYCRARAECSQCYEALFNPQEKDKETKSSLPPPVNANSLHVDEAKLSAERSKTLLQCPNGCRLNIRDGM